MDTPLEVRTDRITPNPHQPRQTFDEAGLRTLAASIRKDGVIQPLVVCPNGTGGTYTLIAGERRLRAAQMAGLETVPVVVRAQPDSRALRRLALVENLNREDLNPIEEARAYREMMEADGLSIDDLAHELGRNGARIRNRLVWLDLDPEIQGLVAEGKLRRDARVARALLSISSPQHRVKLAEKLAHSDASLQASERACSKLAGQLAAQARQEQEPMLARARQRAGAEQPAGPTLPVASIRAAARQMCAQCSVKTRTLADRVGEPAWTLIMHAAHETCDGCPVREVAGACDGCPGVALLSEMIGLQSKKQELDRVRARLRRKP